MKTSLALHSQGRFNIFPHGLPPFQLKAIDTPLPIDSKQQRLKRTLSSLLQTPYLPYLYLEHYFIHFHKHRIITSNMKFMWRTLKSFEVVGD